MVDHISNVLECENVSLDPAKLQVLYQQMGEAGADDVLCRAIEELASRLMHCERLWRDENWSELRKCARSLIAIADQIGMTKLANVARDVTYCVDVCDLPAVGATLRRLIRIGDRSLTAIWDVQDLSV